MSVSGLTLTGSSATNYSLTQPVMLAANITSRAVSVSSGLSANNKVYDGGTSGDDQLEQRGVERGSGGDAAAVALSTNGYGANFASAGVSNGLAVSVSGLTLTGSSATNYSLTQPVMLAANITSQAVSVAAG